MEFIKKQSAGFYLSLLTIILATVGTILYFGNCKTAYFSNLGINTTVVICLVIAILCEIIFLVGNEIMGSQLVLDIFPILAAVLLIIGTVTFITTRVNGMAAIMTFTNNESTMADLNHTIIAIAICFVAFLFSVVTSFFRIVNEDCITISA
ncbi:MAG: hypothetical protein PHT89_09580 [Lachnospiraceae bacterium]|nr:hypothetical protein [Lachnospiraceae bacterium]MDD3660958.1 hypothetical protein [Lachnospiraceae bacterium]